MEAKFDSPEAQKAGQDESFKDRRRKKEKTKEITTKVD